MGGSSSCGCARVTSSCSGLCASGLRYCRRRVKPRPITGTDNREGQASPETIRSIPIASSSSWTTVLTACSHSQGPQTTADRPTRPSNPKSCQSLPSISDLGCKCFVDRDIEECKMKVVLQPSGCHWVVCAVRRAACHDRILVCIPAVAAGVCALPRRGHGSLPLTPRIHKPIIPAL